MTFSNKTYDILKWLVITVLPALLAFFGAVGTTLNLPYTEIVMTIGSAFITCLGAIIGVSSKNYAKKQAKE